MKPSAKRGAAADADRQSNVSSDGMPRHLVLGTAGHIDHGKTSLLHALTGIDCDRLPEEKRRGLTIDIGFAQLDLGDVRLDVIDVPGHERFIKNMLAGAVGIDLALLIVAADDSVMPQTREHLAILQLLGVRHGMVVITKTDRVEAEWLALVEQDVRSLIANTFLQDAAIVRTAVPQSGRPRGLDALRKGLRQTCLEIPAKADTGLFRLPIDRVFSVDGRGTVVTGTVWSGELQVQGTVECLPLGGALAVRGLHRHGSEVDAIRPRQRAAVNLSGVHHSHLRRGQELATAGYLVPSRRMTVDLQVLPDSPRPIKHRSQQRAYMGTQEVMVRVDLLQLAELQPGQRGLAQIHCDADAVAVCGQPLVIREPSPLITIGGGCVLQPRAASISRRQRAKIAWLDRLRSTDDTERAEAAIYFYAASPWSEIDLCRDAALRRCDARGVTQQLIASGQVVSLTGPARQIRAIHRDVWAHLQRGVLQAAERLHARMPLAAAIPRSQIIQSCQRRLDTEVLEAVIDHLLERGTLCGDRQGVALADFAPQLSDSQRRLREALLAALLDSGSQPADAAQLARSTGSQPAEVGPVLQVCVADGTLVHIGEGLYLHRQADAAIRQRMRQQWPPGAAFTVSQLRDLLGTSRKFALPICQYLDRTGFTRRDGDLRRVL